MHVRFRRVVRTFCSRLARKALPLAFIICFVSLTPLVTSQAWAQTVRELPKVDEEETDAQDSSMDETSKSATSRIYKLPPVPESMRLTESLGSIERIEQSGKTHSSLLPGALPQYKWQSSQVEQMPQEIDPRFIPQVPAIQGSQPAVDRIDRIDRIATPNANPTATSTAIPSAKSLPTLSEQAETPPPAPAASTFQATVEANKNTQSLPEKDQQQRGRGGDFVPAEQRPAATEFSTESITQFSKPQFSKPPSAPAQFQPAVVRPAAPPVQQIFSQPERSVVRSTVPAAANPGPPTRSPRKSRTRHPLAYSSSRQEQRPPVMNAPHSTVFDSSLMQTPAQTSESIGVPSTNPQTANPYINLQALDDYTASGELNLVQPPITRNQLNQQPTAIPAPAPSNGRQFWNRFATIPDEKKERTAGYDSIQAILNNGFWFAGVDLMYLEPMFQENNAFVTTSGPGSSAEHVDFGFDISYRGYFGFETTAGPAFKASFFRMDNFSAINDITIGAGQTAVTRVDLGDSDNQFVLGAGASAGSRLTVQQQMKINSTELLFYKDQKNPVSKVRGSIGLRHVSLQQLLFAGLDDPVAGSQVVRNFNDYFGAGPKLGIEYFRPIGHTDLEFQFGMAASLLFGRRDQILNVAGATPMRFEQLGKVEALSIFELYLGVQWIIEISRCQHVFVRSAIESQRWAGSDTALDVGSDFGLYGISFSAGIRR